MKKKLIIGAVLVCICVAGIGLYALLRQSAPEFKGFIEADMGEASYDELLNYPLHYVAEVEVLRKLTNQEELTIEGVDEGKSRRNTFFEVKIVYDYLSENKLGKRIYLSQFGTEEWQLRGDPIYKVGDCYLMILVKSNPQKGYYGAYSGPNSVFDIEEKNGKKYIYKRFGAFSELDNISIQLDNEEKKVYRNGKENPVYCRQKFNLDEFTKKMKQDYDMRRIINE